MCFWQMTVGSGQNCADMGSRSAEYRKLRELPAAEHMGAEDFLSFQAKGCWKQMNLSVVKNIMVQDEYFEHAIAIEVEVDSEDSSDLESVWLAKKRYTEFKELFQKVRSSGVSSQLGTC